MPCQESPGRYKKHNFGINSGSGQARGPNLRQMEKRKEQTRVKSCNKTEHRLIYKQKMAKTIETHNVTIMNYDSVPFPINHVGLIITQNDIRDNYKRSCYVTRINNQR